MNFRWNGAVGARVLGVAAVGVAVASLSAQAPGDVQKAVDAAFAKFRTLKEGKNADYIPALAKVDPALFGIAVVTADGKAYTAGDIKTEVSIQSISKVFTMAQVIQEQGFAQFVFAIREKKRLGYAPFFRGIQGTLDGGPVIFSIVGNGAKIFHVQHQLRKVGNAGAGSQLVGRKIGQWTNCGVGG